MDNEPIRIDGYTSRADVKNRKMLYFAVKGKGKDMKEFPMPEQYKEFYDDKHLAIRKQVIAIPEVMDIPATGNKIRSDGEKGIEIAEVYIPLRTDMND